MLANVDPKPYSETAKRDPGQEWAKSAICSGKSVPCCWVLKSVRAREPLRSGQVKASGGPRCLAGEGLLWSIPSRTRPIPNLRWKTPVNGPSLTIHFWQHVGWGASCRMQKSGKPSNLVQVFGTGECDICGLGSPRRVLSTMYVFLCYLQFVQKTANTIRSTCYHPSTTILQFSIYESTVDISRLSRQERVTSRPSWTHQISHGMS